MADTKPSLLADNIDRHLLDAQVGTQTGGTGHVFDWSLIGDPSQIMLAGGLSPENAQQAAKLGCLGLDLNSGVESAPGKKRFTEVASRISRYSQLLKLFAVIKIREGLSKWQN